MALEPWIKLLAQEISERGWAHHSHAMVHREPVRQGEKVVRGFELRLQGSHASSSDPASLARYVEGVLASRLKNIDVDIEEGEPQSPRSAKAPPQSRVDPAVVLIRGHGEDREHIMSLRRALLKYKELRHPPKPDRDD